MGMLDWLKNKPRSEKNLTLEDIYKEYENTEAKITDENTINELNSYDSIDSTIDISEKSSVVAEDDKYEELFNDFDFKYILSKGFNIQTSLIDDEIKKQIPKEFLDKCLDENYLSLLSENLYNLRTELIQKIIYNSLTLDDLTNDEYNLIKFLPSSERVDILKNKKELEIDLNAKYVVIEGNDSLSADIQDKNTYIDSYFENMPILFQKQSYVKLVSVLNDNDIKIINKSNGNFCQEGYVVDNESILNEDSIIVITFEKYKELSKNPDLLAIFKSHQLCISDDYDETRKLWDINIDEDRYFNCITSIDYEKAETLKDNHLKEVISKSNLTSIEKKDILYRLNPFTMEKISKQIADTMSLNDLYTITNDFNNLPKETKFAELNKEEYRIELFYYEHPDFFELPIEKQMNVLLHLSDKEFKVVMASSKVNNIFTKEIANKNDLYQYQQVLNRAKGIEQNQCVKDFVENNGLNVQDMLDNPIFDLKNEFDINPILGENYISAGRIEQSLTMEDIAGISKWHMRDASNNIVDNFKNFFDANGDGYHTRGLSMLEFKDGQEAMDKLKRSFIEEPLKLDEYDGKYIISGNGLHRTMVLKFFYMKDLAEGILSEEELRKKYTIPGCVITKVNNEKSYTAYLLKLLDSTITGVYDSNQENCDLVIYTKDKQALNLPIAEIKEKIKMRLENADEYELSKIAKCCESYASFREFINNDYGEYITSMSESEELTHGKDI